jgi:hypothetical protein
MNHAEEILAKLVTPGHARWGLTILEVEDYPGDNGERVKCLSDTDGNSVDLTDDEARYVRHLIAERLTGADVARMR